MACMSKSFAATNYGSVLNLNQPRRVHFRFAAKIKMSSHALPPLPENRVVVGYGMTTVDFLATVDGYPQPNDKVRSSSLKVEGGGNAGRAVMKFRANGIGTICGRFYIGTAEKIPDSELIDTTGAGDAFIGAILYAICANMVPEKMLPLAAQVAAVKCRALGARSGLPRRTDPRLASFLC